MKTFDDIKHLIIQLSRLPFLVNALDERVTNLELIESPEKRIRNLEIAIANITGRQDRILYAIETERITAKQRRKRKTKNTKKQKKVDDENQRIN